MKTKPLNTLSKTAIMEGMSRMENEFKETFQFETVYRIIVTRAGEEPQVIEFKSEEDRVDYLEELLTTGKHPKPKD